MRAFLFITMCLVMGLMLAVLTGCTSQAKYDQMAAAANDVITCQQRVAEILDAQAEAEAAAHLNGQQFKDESHFTIHIMALGLIKAATANSGPTFSECDDALVAMINSDERYKTAMTNNAFGLLRFTIGTAGAVIAVDSIADALDDSGGDTYNNSRVANGGSGDGSSTSASGDGEIVGNTSAVDDATNSGGFFNPPPAPEEDPEEPDPDPDPDPEPEQPIEDPDIDPVPDDPVIQPVN